VRTGSKLAGTTLLALPSFYLLWIVFVGTFALHELLIGVVAALLATLGLLVVNVNYSARFSPSLRDLLSLWRLGWYLFSGTGEVLLVALKDLLRIKPAESIFRIAPFRAGSRKDSCDTARRVLAVAYTTVAPNFIVLGINSTNQQLLFHQIERSSVPQMTKDLGAGE
jgi:multisubunit Na+/H+ antiporter MnhE subunit